jgi:hypothetical protein
MRKDSNNTVENVNNNDFNVEEIEQVVAPAFFDGEIDASTSALSTSILTVCRCS